MTITGCHLEMNSRTGISDCLTITLVKRVDRSKKKKKQWSKDTFCSSFQLRKWKKTHEYKEI